MSLNGRIDRLEGHVPEEYCPFVFTMTDVDGRMLGWWKDASGAVFRRNEWEGVPSGAEPIYADEFAAIQAEHETTCEICRGADERGVIRGVDFRPYDPDNLMVDSFSG